MQFGVGRRFLETPPSATGVDNGWAETAPWWTMTALSGVAKPLNEKNENTDKRELVIKIVTFIATLLLYTQQFSLSTLYIKIGNRRHFEDIANIDDVLKHD